MLYFLPRKIIINLHAFASVNESIIGKSSFFSPRAAEPHAMVEKIHFVLNRINGRNFVSQCPPLDPIIAMTVIIFMD